MVTNLGCLGITLRRSSGSLSFTFKATCIRNLFHQDRRWRDGKFYCDILRRLREIIQRCHDLWGQNNDNALAHASFVVQQFLASTKTSHPPPSLLTKPRPMIFSYSQWWKWSLRGNILTALKRSRLHCRTWWRCWRDMTSSSASNHGNSTGITVSLQKGLLQWGWSWTEISVRG
jgi:hypothetical protein